MAIAHFTKSMDAFAKLKADLDDLRFNLDDLASNLQHGIPSSKKNTIDVLQHACLDISSMLDTLREAITLATEASTEIKKGELIDLSDKATAPAYNFAMSTAAHALSVQVSGLMVHMLRRRTFCACDATGVCAAHADAYNELLFAEQHLTDAAKQFYRSRR